MASTVEEQSKSLSQVTMSNTQHCDTQEELRPSEPSMPEPTSDNTSTTKTLISVDAVPAKALLAGKTDKGSFSSRTPDTSASLHGCKPAECRLHTLSHGKPSSLISPGVQLINSSIRTLLPKRNTKEIPYCPHLNSLIVTSYLRLFDHVSYHP